MKIDKLLNYIYGVSNADEKIEAYEWIHKTEANKSFFLQLRRIIDYTAFYSPNKSKEERSTASRWRFVKVAAAILLIATTTFFLTDRKESISNQLLINQVHVAKGNISQLLLSDSTEVWLNSNTVLYQPTKTSPNERRIKVQGGAFFDVKHKAHKPFIVELDGYNIKVHGTKFNVNAYPNDDHIIVSLLSGSIELTDTLNNSLVKLTPNQEITIKDNQIKVSKILNPEVFNWRKGILSFEQQSYTEIFSVLERTYNVSFSYKQSKFRNEYFSGKFRKSDGIEHLLSVLKANRNFNYKYDKKINVIFITL
ncbi:FecR family protein [Prolixibacteraceae bacterium JC049]|nr:FecR family protein [Prolixibacteraceae bacterium JC049]